ncbi:hypothetical protein CAI16_08420 [Virgibacillus dokdonensis]|uniref:Uncharacterized protein n=1 Tax=Virgibacillus dokdonensis TaxID=302167 RepID=A0A3E0WU70_9BACI|nr:hypothetical protein [Virgibacillus dokdonensis]RFA35507.1 hypothetical protein CAI16_08420 [Virgibacillus dokdonensis]
MNIWSIILIPLAIVGGLFFFNFLSGQGKGKIVFDLDKRYVNYGEYIQAILQELKKQGKQAFYEGNGRFIIDGSPYTFIEWNVNLGGVPTQRTVLKQDKIS